MSSPVLSSGSFQVRLRYFSFWSSEFNGDLFRKMVVHDGAVHFFDVVHVVVSLAN